MFKTLQKPTLSILTLLASAAFANSAVITSGLVGEYTFEGSNANDSTGLIGNGVAVGTPTYSSSVGRTGTVLNLSGGNYISIANSANIPSGNASRSVSLWMQVTTYVAASGPFRTGANSNSQDFSIELNATFGTLRANGWNADTSFTVPAGGTGENGWHHVVVTYDGSTVRTYVDGGARATGGPFTLNTATNGIRFGGPRITAGTNDGAVQSVDDVLVYNRVLSGAEVSNIFNNVPEPSTAVLGLVGLLALMRRRRAC